MEEFICYAYRSIIRILMLTVHNMKHTCIRVLTQR